MLKTYSMIELFRIRTNVYVFLIVYVSHVSQANHIFGTYISLNFSFEMGKTQSNCLRLKQKQKQKNTTNQNYRLRIRIGYGIKHTLSI